MIFKMHTNYRIFQTFLNTTHRKITTNQWAEFWSPGPVVKSTKHLTPKARGTLKKKKSRRSQKSKDRGVCCRNFLLVMSETTSVKSH